MSSSTTSKSRVILGPLTTTFTPPATCSVLGIDDSSAGQAYQAQHCFTAAGSSSTVIFSGGVADDHTCWPSTSIGLPQPGQVLGGWGFYSPGLECPYGYAPTCLAAKDSDGALMSVSQGTQSFDFQFRLLAGETAIGCCPTSYFCLENGGQQTCLSHATTSQVLQVTQCVSYTLTSTYDLTVTSPIDAFAPLIQLVYQSSDIQSAASRGSTVTETVGKTSTHPAQQSTTTNPPQGLDTGAKAGIGVGVGVGVLLILCAFLGWFLIRRRRRSSSKSAPETHAEPPAYPNNNAVQSEEYKYSSVPAGELSGTPMAELEQPRSELPVTRD